MEYPRGGGVFLFERPNSWPLRERGIRMSLSYYPVSFMRGLCVLMLAASALACCCSPATATAPDLTPDQLVEEALHHRLYGENEASNRLLQKAIELDPTHAAAHWHLGFIRPNAESPWAPAEQAIVEDQQSDALREYYRIRGTFRNTVVSQMQAADWCRDRDLSDQERAHLTNVLEIKPSHEPALLRLGFEPIPGGWASRDQLQAAEEAADAKRVALERWRPRIERIRAEMMKVSHSRRIKARDALLAIENAEAIGALEELLSNESQWHAEIVLDVLRNMTDPAASISLARHAVYSPWHDVRQEAARSLRKRPYDEYVPAMLETMQSRVDARVATRRTRTGYETSLLLVRETQNSFDRQRFNDVRPTAELAVAIHRDNARIDLRNQMIAEALNVATEQDLESDPNVWWGWWDDHNEVYVEGDKPVRDFSREAELARIDRIQDFWQQEQQRDAQRWIESDIRNSIPQRRKDCLAAGTPVWTSRGKVAIEQMQPGDMVLSQNEETGELDYKVVLRTTIRPEEQLIRVHTGQEAFLVSGGHPFWVVGRGWTKARELNSGMTLHTLRGTVQISGLSAGPEERTYNLIVADFNTYFIGDSRTLTHDNTTRQPSNLVLPGMAWE